MQMLAAQIIQKVSSIVHYIWVYLVESVYATSVGASQFLFYISFFFMWKAKKKHNAIQMFIFSLLYKPNYKAYCYVLRYKPYSSARKYKKKIRCILDQKQRVTEKRYTMHCKSVELGVLYNANQRQRFFLKKKKTQKKSNYKKQNIIKLKNHEQ